MTSPLLTAGSMCSGYGGLDLAVSAVLRTRLLWVADNDPNAARCLTHRFPGISNLGDIRAADWTSVPAPDVLTAGFPCQPISSAGLGLGMDDERWLFDDIADAVGRMEPRPRLLVFENVARLLSVNDGHAMARVLHRLAALGYVGRYRVVRACDIGAPHERARIFILAWPAHPQSPGREGANPERGGTAGDSVLAVAHTAYLRHQRDRHPGAGRSGPAHRRGADASPGTRQLGRPARSDIRWGRYEPAIRRWEHLTGRSAPDPTEPAPRGGRRLAPAFSEWLMGLPAGWVTDVPDISRNGQLHLIGNGVVPQQATAALLDLLPDHLAVARRDAA
ncbi:DNA cytosine methyltransferase [Sphaerisporangium sp. NPDC004334]